MLQSYAKFVSQIFFPELDSAAGFYNDLLSELGVCVPQDVQM
jgi:hypothetical protein